VNMAGGGHGQPVSLALGSWEWNLPCRMRSSFPFVYYGTRSRGPVYFGNILHFVKCKRISLFFEIAHGYENIYLYYWF
jgi:hypothetical protein